MDDENLNSCILLAESEGVSALDEYEDYTEEFKLWLYDKVL